MNILFRLIFWTALASPIAGALWLCHEINKLPANLFGHSATFEDMN